MPTNNDATGLTAYGINLVAAALNGLLIFIGDMGANEWGVLFAILFGGVTAAVNFWAKRRLVKVAEESGRVSL